MKYQYSRELLLGRREQNTGEKGGFVISGVYVEYGKGASYPECQSSHNIDIRPQPPRDQLMDLKNHIFQEYQERYLETPQYNPIFRSDIMNSILIPTHPTRKRVTYVSSWVGRVGWGLEKFTKGSPYKTVKTVGELKLLDIFLKLLVRIPLPRFPLSQFL